MASKKEDSFIEEFGSNPDEKNWKLFLNKAKKDKARYYHVIYPQGVKNKLSLSGAYAVIYNSSYKQLYKIPIIKKTKNGIEGATIYLKELEVNRRVL